MYLCVYTPFYESGYGVGHSVEREIYYLSKKGYKILVVHRQKDLKVNNNPGVSFHYLKYNPIPLLGVLIYGKRLTKFIKKTVSEIDVFYINSPEFGLLNNKYLKKANIIYFARSSIKGINKSLRKGFISVYLNKILLNLLLIKLEKRCLRSCRKIVVKSNLMKEELIDLYKVNKDKICVISGGVDKVLFPKMDFPEIENFKKNILKLNSNKKILLFCGRVTPIKGLYYLICAYSTLVTKFDNLVLLIIGDSLMDNYTEIIKKLIKLFKLADKVKLLGYVKQNEVYKYINASEIVVTPSVYEPFGMINIQAYILNKPIITTDIVGSNEVIKGYHMLNIVEPYSVEFLENALFKYFFRNEQKCISDNKVKEYLGWDQVANKLDLVFKD